MLLSLTGAFRGYSPTYGYGVAAHNIVEGFKKNGINFEIPSYDADIEIFWGHPPYEFSKNGLYKIGYTAWESTGFKVSWEEQFGLKQTWDVLMQEADEIWTPSQWLSDHWAKVLGKPTFTYPHGVDIEWKPVRRYPPFDGMPFRFLHIGEPQFRKNGQLVVEAFAELFGNNPNYQLILKSSGINTTRIYSKPSGSIIGSPDLVYNNILIIDSILEKDQLIELHNKSHCLAYPTGGEGFGFHPLEAAASGLPTISTIGWCDYKEYISVPIDAPLTDSPWPDLHPGQLFQPTLEQVKESMVEMVENYDRYAKEAFKNAFKVHEEWNWDVQNKKAQKRLEDIYISRISNDEVVN